MGYYSFAVGNEQKGKRIDAYLAQELNELSRNRIQKLVDEGAVAVCGKTVNKNYKLKERDFIELIVPEPVDVEIRPQNIPLDIVYEDEDICVVNKNRGMVVHPAPGHSENTLVNALMYHCESLSGINGEIRPGIVHRIDKDTSGLLAVAKNDAAHRFLAEQFAMHSITRMYAAITANKMHQKSGTVDKPIGRDPKNRKKMAVTEKNSKRAVTHFDVKEDLGRHSLIECRLETGRTHQIRVHLASIGHPLLGDTVYGASKQPYGIEGQILHAKTLGFIHPSSKKYIEFDTNYPEYFEKVVLMLKNKMH